MSLQSGTHFVTIFSKTITFSMLAAGGLALSGCGDAISSEALAEEFAKTCPAEFADQGLPDGTVEPFCDCFSDQITEKELGPFDLVSPEKMSNITEECMLSVMEGQGLMDSDAAAAVEETPAE